MCKSRGEGGQRCYSHARKALDAAYAAHAKLEPRRVLRALGNSEAIPGHVESALAGRILRAQIDLASTPQGRDEFRQQAEKAATKGDTETTARLLQVVRHGEFLQERNASLSNLNRNDHWTKDRRPATSTMRLTSDQIRQHLALPLTTEQASAAGRDLEASLRKLSRSADNRTRYTGRQADTIAALMINSNGTDGRSEYNRRGQQWAAFGNAAQRWETITETPDQDAPAAWQRFINETRDIRDNPPNHIAFIDDWRRDNNYILRVCGEIAHEHTRPRNPGPGIVRPLLN